MKWVTIDSLGKPWERARLDAEVLNDHVLSVSSSNVTAFTLSMGPGTSPLDVMHKPIVTIDGQPVTAAAPMTDRSWTAHFIKSGGKWDASDTPREAGVHKRHGLQPPVH